MALTAFQREVCRTIAGTRIASGESYVAGAVALNELIAASRVSRDIDLFHDTEEALEATWDGDRKLLEGRGFAIRILRERRAYGAGCQSTLVNARARGRRDFRSRD